MIRRLTLHDFRGIEHAQFEFGDFTLLVGPNGIGKSAVLDAIYLGSLWTQLPERHHENLLAPFSKIFTGAFVRSFQVRVGAAAARVETVGAASGDGEHEATGVVTVVGTIARAEEGREDSLVLHTPMGEPERADNSSSSHVPERYRQLINSANEQLGRSVRLRLNVDAVLSHSHSAVPGSANTYYDGAGLAASLLAWVGEDRNAFAEYVGAVTAVIPEIVDLRTRVERVPQRVSRDIKVEHTIVATMFTEVQDVSVLEAKTRDGYWLNAAQLSEGTLLTLAILAVVRGPNQPDILLIDDIDRGLHPRAQHELVEQLRAVQAARPGLQIIASTHSPYLVDEFQPSDVLVMGRASDGKVLSRSLATHPDIDRGFGLNAGELWSVVGESWNAESAASSEK